MSGEGMGTAITAFETAGLTGSALWGEIGTLAAFIVPIAIFAFGFDKVRKLIKGTQKGKVKI